MAVTCSICFGLAGLISSAAAIDGTYEATPGKTVAIHLGLLVSHALINTFGVRILGHLNTGTLLSICSCLCTGRTVLIAWRPAFFLAPASIVLHSLGVFSFAVAILAKAPMHQTAKFVFTKFYDGTGVAVGDLDPIGWAQRASPAYVCVIGVLMAQYTITGFDASAHMVRLSLRPRRRSSSPPRN